MQRWHNLDVNSHLNFEHLYAAFVHLLKAPPHAAHLSTDVVLGHPELYNHKQKQQHFDYGRVEQFVVDIVWEENADRDEFQNQIHNKRSPIVLFNVKSLLNL